MPIILTVGILLMFGSNATANEVSDILAQLNGSKEEFIRADQNPGYLISGEVYGYVCMLKAELWKLDKEAHWDAKNKEFVIQDISISNLKGAGLVLLYDSIDASWNLEHPDVPPCVLNLTDEQLTEAIQRIKITNIVAIYPGNCDRFPNQLTLISRIAHSIGDVPVAQISYLLCEQVAAGNVR